MWTKRDVAAFIINMQTHSAEYSAAIINELPEKTRFIVRRDMRHMGVDPAWYAEPSDG